MSSPPSITKSRDSLQPAAQRAYLHFHFLLRPSRVINSLSVTASETANKILLRFDEQHDHASNADRSQPRS